ncbi:hypothetical protein QL995_11510 [Pseudoalteromonas sp. APC 3358]|uniref:hypothetical protein n=1 Tax=Pseudoalteromonas sp. APC 3358 TaxID=3035176 RepID=UPI0025B3E2F3|nr:hypothetical protein [Pseudoalteromonas sp. APC 3358]MDN3383287.1 hypothetical protein [Pseudoalteromonas sp. APC 3358]
MSASHSMPMVVNNINPLTMVKPAFVFMYQVDPNSPKYDKEQLILINKQHSWQQVQSIASVRLDSTWVKIKFTNIPQSGNFDLMQDPNDGQPAYYIFDNVPFSELYDQTPESVLMAEIVEE